MGFDINEISKNSKGGTELMLEGLGKRLDPTLLEDFQIIPSRVRELDDTKIRVLWLHDLPGDPESEHLKNGGHEKFHQLVFVSNWQMQQYVAYYKLPWSKCFVIENAIEPTKRDEINKSTDKIKLIYHTTPHRGLEILIPVFEKLAEKYDNIELDVFSSFKIYGWEHRDEDFKQLFDACRNHPKINYHGTAPNEVIRETLKQSHIFAYPSIWVETSCISLMEAMTSECLCVHPNYGALYETAGGTTMMYQMQDKMHDHANAFYSQLDNAIELLNTQDHEMLRNFKGVQKGYADLRYNWERVTNVWTNLLTNLQRRYPTVESRKNPGMMFHYQVG